MKKYKATINLDGKEVSFESDVIPITSKHCRKVEKPKDKPIHTKEDETFKTKTLTRKEVRELFNKINL